MLINRDDAERVVHAAIFDLCMKDKNTCAGDYSAYALEALRALPVSDGWEELAKHTNWELDHGEIDPTDEGGDHFWRVHSVNGGRSDRECTLIGYGDTPQEAIAAAVASTTSPAYD
jgi:hypothetical protein